MDWFSCGVSLLLLQLDIPIQEQIKENINQDIDSCSEASVLRNSRSLPFFNSEDDDTAGNFRSTFVCTILGTFYINFDTSHTNIFALELKWAYARNNLANCLIIYVACCSCLIFLVAALVEALFWEFYVSNFTSFTSVQPRPLTEWQDAHKHILLLSEQWLKWFSLRFIVPVLHRRITVFASPLLAQLVYAMQHSSICTDIGLVVLHFFGFEESATQGLRAELININFNIIANCTLLVGSYSQGQATL